MEASATRDVRHIRIDNWGKGKFIVTFATALVVFAGFVAIGAFGPPQVIYKPPAGGSGTDVNLLDTICPYDEKHHILR